MSKKKIIFIWPTVAVWLASFLILIFLFIGNISPLLASWESIEAQKLLLKPNRTEDDFNLALEKYERSLKRHTFTNPETNKILPPMFFSGNNASQTASDQQAPAEQISDSTRIIISHSLTQQLEQSIQEMPLFYDSYLNLTNIYNIRSIENPIYLQNGEEIMKKLLEIYPKTPQFYYKLIVNRLLAQDLNAARDMAEKSIQINPRLPIGWWYLGTIYYYAGDYAAAQKNTEQAIKNGYGYNNLPSLFFLGQLYDKLNNYGKALSYYQSAAELSPLDQQIRLSIAKDYKALGQTEKARELAQKLLSSSTPQTAPEIKEFLGSLK